MSSFLQKHYRGFYLLLPILLGVSLGHLAATALGIYLAPPILPAGGEVSERPAPAKPAALPDYQVVLERNIFDSTARQTATLTGEESGTPAAAAPVVRTDLTLFGTVTRGAASLAVIKAGQEVKTYRLGEQVPGGGLIEEIQRLSVQIRAPDGTIQTLSLFKEPESRDNRAAAPGPTSGTPNSSASSAPAAADSAAGEIRSVGENRWVIPQALAEDARGNVSELLKQARVEPNIVNGKTQGFVVRMIQPRSLLAGLGIQRGDVLMQVNGIELDSPEKALQIFQQLREAKNISIGLLRNGNSFSFEYEIN
jgi:general secretion pathway protein C